jgi:hypothetical protein
VHTLVGGGGQHGGFDALDFRKIKHHDGDAGKFKLGNYLILSVLPDKLARFLHEFHDIWILASDSPDIGYFPDIGTPDLGSFRISGTAVTYPISGHF